MRIEVYNALADSEVAWTALEQRCECYVFQTWKWNAAWQAHVGDVQSVRPRIVHVTDASGSTLGIWPLGIYRQGSLRVLGFLGDVVSDYRAPLLAPEWFKSVDPKQFPEFWQECLRLIGEVDLVALERMPEQLGGWTNPMVGLPDAVQAENAYAIRLPDSMAEYLAGRSKQMLAHNRRGVRRLQELGDYTFTPEHGQAEMEEIFSAIVRLKTRRWQETGSEGLFAQQAYLNFYRVLTQSELQDGMVALCSLKVGSTVVAAQWGLRFRGRYYWILPCYETGPWAKYSCGRILLQSMIEWASEQKLSVFDLTVGDESYKKDWANEHLPLWRWRQARSPRGRVYLAYVQLRARARGNETLRCWVQRLKKLIRGGRHVG
ncbi:GNAT family N-acetyltransferase [Pusillimonas sp. CC-YST705]|uniref:GNAT family N-acetyltransferase n=1 Tax=Mesopusillimonas faecipullorum TaxID=2755040 RepID=A0ABS8CER8_9BURK|nr:GNAT family N-acetyltransferase [Mesopusillimonas faecipullorum]MCB5364552.1 GNAT family N-acetyltransferase [Mesopusillimonas faecipullorum]